jgi:glycosyltransferase involved in cell wall biosynthesis
MNLTCTSDGLNTDKPKDALPSRFYFDSRWIGSHGIGSFAREFLKRAPALNVITTRFMKPVHPLDSFNLNYILKKNNADFFFSPGYNAPFKSPCPYVFTVHDLNHFDVPENSSVLKRLYYDRFLKPACWRAEKILTVSDFSKKRILDWTGVSEDKVVNVSNGADEKFTSYGEKFDFHKPYIFFVGNRKPHKNLDRAMHAFATADIDNEIVFLLTGTPDPCIYKKAKTLGMQERLFFCGFISDEKMPCYYRGAVATLFPSLYEGFGLPIIESMRCGTPVITSNLGAMKEISAAYACLVDPFDIGSIKLGIETTINDAVIWNNKLNLANMYLQEFTWDNTFQKIQGAIDVFN